MEVKEKGAGQRLKHRQGTGPHRSRAEAWLPGREHAGEEGTDLPAQSREWARG